MSVELYEVKDVEITQLDDNEVKEYTKDIDAKTFCELGDTFQLYIKDLSRYPLLTLEEERNLTRRYYEDKDMDARQALINHNLRLVINIAKKFQFSSLPLVDLIQEGNIGLITAVEKFNPNLDFRFSTYATWWIKQSVMRGISNSSRMIRMPVHAEDCAYRYYKYVKKFREANGSVELPPITQIAKELDVSVEVLKLTILTSDVVSLNTPVGEECDSTLIDYIPAEQDVETQVESILLRDYVETLLEDFDERTRDVVELRYGLRGRGAHTLDEIGNKYGLTRERIRQIEVQAIRKLRRRKSMDLIGDYK